MLGHAPISFPDFVFRGPGRARPVWSRGVRVPMAAALSLGLALGGAGCTRSSGTLPVEDTETSGRISIAASTDAQQLLAREVAAFRATYPQAAL